MYRGEVKEYVVGDHITLKIDSGEVFRVAWADAVQISPPRSKQPSAAATLAAPPPASSPPPPPSSPPPSPSKVPPIANVQPVPTPVPPSTERTVVTQSGMTYSGEVREFEAGSHILLLLASGERQRIPWAQAKHISPAHHRGDSDPAGSPARTVILADGSSLRGDLVESQLGEYTTVKLASGQLRRIAWKDAKRILLPTPSGKPSPIPTTGELLVVLDNGKRLQGEYFEYIPGDQLVLRHTTGGFRFIPIGAIKKIVLLGEGGP
jgi:hypothetical protein